jgi:hypothetical protein
MALLLTQPQFAKLALQIALTASSRLMFARAANSGNFSSTINASRLAHPAYVLSRALALTALM